MVIRRGARVVDRDGLENRCACKRTVGSNPTLSAILLRAARYAEQALQSGSDRRGEILETETLVASSGCATQAMMPILIRESRQAYATTLLSSVKRSATTPSRIILAYRKGPRETGSMHCMHFGAARRQVRWQGWVKVIRRNEARASARFGSSVCRGERQDRA